MSGGLSCLTLRTAIRHAAEYGPSDIFEALEERARTLNGRINAFVRFPGAAGSDQKDPRPRNTPLRGLPIAFKDNICIEGQETSCASKILKGHVPPYDATVVRKLRAAGATIQGQCNMDEFAFGSSCETSAYGVCRNPWDTERVPGGSSGGSAAVVASDMALAALGSDTGGSIRQPAAFCGVVGLKPTYGRVSRYGLIAFGSSFDQIGPLTKTVEDSAVMLNFIAGYDPLDSTSVDRPVPDFTKALRRDVKGLRIGIPKEYSVDGIDPEVQKSVQDAAGVLKKLGADIQSVSLPHTNYSVAVYYIVAVAEASSNLGRYDGVQYGLRIPEKNLREMYLETRDHGFGEEAKRRVLLGTFVLSAGYYEAFYLKGQKVRTLIRRDFENAFRNVDVLLAPTTPTPAFKIGEKINDPLAMYLSDIFTIPVNLAGVPAISVPCGFTKGKLPIGLQLIGRPFDEETLLRTAYAFEQETEFYKIRPNL
jgi:aspartyl-tRNA(Asn)/glutamyl-tRNA(Gln) amidotransferase subunit A